MEARGSGPASGELEASPTAGSFWMKGLLYPQSLAWWLLVLSALLGCGSQVAWSAEAMPDVKEKLVMGWLETVFLQPINLRVTAKLDTGAKTSSVHAGKVERFERDGVPWVRFAFIAGEDKKSLLIERPLVRTAIIKERQSRSSTRDVVKLTICKNGKYYETEFTLNDRSNFNYPILLGRSFLAEVALVDSSSTFLYKADSDACVGLARNSRLPRQE